MQRLSKKILSGCFFLCLGGLVCNSGVSSGESANQPAPSSSVAAQTLPSALAPTSAPVGGPAGNPPTTEVNANLSATNVAVSDDGLVEMHVQDMDISTTLHLLSLQGQRNIVASKDVKGTVTANLYKVTFFEALDAILTPNGYGYIERGNFIYVYTQKELEDIRKRDRKAVNRIFRLHYITATDAQTLIKPMLSATGVVAITPSAVSGISPSQTDTGGESFSTDDTLVVNDFPENLSEVEKALKDLDARPKQVLIEATILRASLNENNALGVDLVSLSGVDFSSMTSGKFSNNTTPGVFDAFQQGNVPKPHSTQGMAGTDFSGNVPQGGLSVGFLSNNINIFLRALEETTDTTIVANPKILALNKQRGEVFVGDHTGYKTTTTTSTTTSETVQFLDTGTKLIFRPSIGDDGYVRLEVHPEDSAGGLTSQQLPFTHSTEVTSNLMIKDGRTVVIGGLFREETTAGRGQVPVLGNIPVLGIPFRRTNDAVTRNETIILITPHIINDDTAMYAEAEKKQEDVARMMLGNRAGLQPWGRDRLAQTWFAKAQEAQDKGDREKALMYTDWALNTNPRFIEAIKLRELLTHQKVQEADESSIHNFVRDVIRDDRGTPNPGGGGHYAPTIYLNTPAQTMPATAPAGSELQGRGPAAK